MVGFSALAHPAQIVHLRVWTPQIAVGAIPEAFSFRFRKKVCLRSPIPSEHKGDRTIIMDHHPTTRRPPLPCPPAPPRSRPTRGTQPARPGHLPRASYAPGTTPLSTA